MKFAAAALCVICALAALPARAEQRACGEVVRLSVDPVARQDEIAATLRRRLAAAGAKTPSVEADGAAGLRVALPEGVSESILTRPAKIEFRLVARSADEPGVVSFPRADGGAAEIVEPQIIVDEMKLRQIKVVQEPDPAGGPPVVALAFHFETVGVNNLLIATNQAVGRKLAILVDDRIVADPVLRGPVASRTGEIAGGFTLQSANELVALLGDGRLVAHVTVASREPCKAP
jgi:preprotein translocase subunit SecD